MFDLQRPQQSDIGGQNGGQIEISNLSNLRMILQAYISYLQT